MAEIPLASFLPKVLPYVRDCPDMVAIGSIRDAIIEFCNETHWWVEKLDPISTQANVAIYELDVPVGTELVMIESLRVSDRPVRPVSSDNLNSRYGYSNWQTLTGLPAYYTFTEPNEVRLVPMPEVSASLAIDADASLRPVQDAMTVTETIYNRWAEQIGFGARSKLQSIPSQSYSDPNAAAQNRMLFAKGKAEAKIEKNASKTRGPVYVYRRRWV